MKKWKEADPEDRERDFLPQKYNSLREVPAYPRFIRERFERCLDLYLCPRQLKMRVSETHAYVHPTHISTPPHTDTCAHTFSILLPCALPCVVPCVIPCAPPTRVQVNIDDPSVLLPKLPKPKDLHPFPTSEAIVSDICMYVCSDTHGMT